MIRSTDRILTTHTGSLPRPPDLIDLLWTANEGEDVDAALFAETARRAVRDVVQKQVDTGIDVINDGEQAKPNYATYITDRLTGFGGEGVVRRAGAEHRDFPSWSARFVATRPRTFTRPVCIGPVEWRDFSAVERDIENLRIATEGTPATEVFMSAASPGVIATFIDNEYYPTHEAYLEALAAVMRREYEAIHAAGFLLQVDCPDLAMDRHTLHTDRTDAEFVDIARMHVDVVNEATKNIPPDRLRLHLCWGNYEGPHHQDIALREIIEAVLQSRAQAISFEAANPRHEHEWAVWDEVKLPSDRIVIPGVVDSTSNFIEHPDLIAQRLTRFANAVGRENVIAGTDCGFGTSATSDQVDGEIAWAKLASMVEGARIASSKLW